MALSVGRTPSSTNAHNSSISGSGSSVSSLFAAMKILRACVEQRVRCAGSSACAARAAIARPLRTRASVFRGSALSARSRQLRRRRDGRRRARPRQGWSRPARRRDIAALDRRAPSAASASRWLCGHAVLELALGAGSPPPRPRSAAVRRSATKLIPPRNFEILKASCVRDRRRARVRAMPRSPNTLCVRPASGDVPLANALKISGRADPCRFGSHEQIMGQQPAAPVDQLALSSAVVSRRSFAEQRFERQLSAASRP